MKFLMGAAALFWGWQTGNLPVGAALAAAFEAPNFVHLRIGLRDTDYRRISDFCAVLFAGVVALLFVNRGAARGVLGALQWFPVLVAPLYVAQRFGEEGLIRTSALFLYVRRQLRRDPAFPDPLVDLSGPYLAVLAISAGTGNSAGPGYFAGVVALAAWALYLRRPRAVAPALFALVLGAGAAGGYAGQAGLARLQGVLEAWIDEWLVMLPNDAERTVTRIGTIGRIKEHDSIALRLYAPRGAYPKLLHNASFNEYRDGTWLAREGALGAPPAPAAATSTVAIVLRVAQTGRTLLPLPAGTAEIAGLSELPLRRGRLGAATTEAQRGWLRYEASYGDAAAGYAPPGPQDMVLPEAEASTLKRLAAELGGGDSVSKIERHFSSFRYSTFREQGPAAGMTALEDFLLRTKSGHCEYFATAATLLLRAAGIPARYATGYAAIEYSRLEGAWLVRARHAHAWSRAWIGGRWVDVDVTPPDWPEAESSLSPPWEGIADLARWLLFRWTTRGETEVSPLAWVAAAAAAALLAGLLLRRRRAVRRGAETASPAPRWPGADSEFYAIERSLAARFRPRAMHEPLAVWLADLRKDLLPEEQARLERLSSLHHRYRFDPRGLSAEERAALRQ